mmetsp:Transcript_2514/g.4061  ORF Transcript_2514/g.4061 Transcript_2514/m.4061 type:complete len:167 (-) Transcript_2514:110-610(-)
MDFDSELASLNRDLSFFPQRAFDFKEFSMVIDQDIGDVGGQVWDAEIILAHYFDQKENSASQSWDAKQRGQKVLEVGAGTGIAGLVCSFLGAEVVLTDVEPTLRITDRTAASVDTGNKVEVAGYGFRSPLFFESKEGHGLGTTYAQTSSLTPLRYRVTGRMPLRQL